MIVEDLKLMGYREAWERQECAHEGVVAGGEVSLDWVGWFSFQFSVLGSQFSVLRFSVFQFERLD